MTNLRLSGKLELDEAMFGGHHKGKREWGAEGKTLVFGIYKRNGHVITFLVPDRKYDTLMELIKKHTRKGSLHYTDDYTAYASLIMRGKHKLYLMEWMSMSEAMLTLTEWKGFGVMPRLRCIIIEVCTKAVFSFVS